MGRRFHLTTVSYTHLVAGITGTKRTSDLIPLCHPLMLSNARVDFTILAEECAVEARCTVKLDGKTGVEMEALTGVTVALQMCIRDRYDCYYRLLSPGPDTRRNLTLVEELARSLGRPPQAGRSSGAGRCV